MIDHQMTYQKSAAYYDAIYSFKDYAHEAELLHRIIQTHKHSNLTSMFDNHFTHTKLFVTRDSYDPSTP